MEDFEAYNRRKEELNELSQFIANKQKLFSGILEKTGWTLDSLIDEKKMVQCPHNKDHRITESSLEKHVKICCLIEEGYTKDELEKEPSSSQFFYAKSASVVPIYIDKEELNNIVSHVREQDSRNLTSSTADMKEIPQTADRYMTDFSPQERLAIYDYVVEKGKSVKKQAEVTVQDLLVDFENPTDQSDKPKSYLEVLAEQRDYKRRRQSYRAKNVHNTKKSYTEVMREVIENQIQYLTETQKEEIQVNESSKHSNSEHKADADEMGSDKSDERSSDDEDRRRRKKHHHHKHKRSHSSYREKHKKHKKHHR